MKESRLNRLAENLMKHIKQFEKEVREDERKKQKPKPESGS